ncbi:MAG: hypothetical protein ACK59A_04895 [Cyanobacteriota bacterium]
MARQIPGELEGRWRVFCLLAEAGPADNRSVFKDLCPHHKARLLLRLETVMAFSLPMG